MLSIEQMKGSKFRLPADLMTAKIQIMQTGVSLADRTDLGTFRCEAETGKHQKSN